MAPFDRSPPFCIGLRHQTSDVRHQTSDIRHQTSDIRHQTSDIRHQTSDIRVQSPESRVLARWVRRSSELPNSRTPKLPNSQTPHMCSPPGLGRAMVTASTGGGLRGHFVLRVTFRVGYTPVWFFPAERAGTRSLPEFAHAGVVPEDVHTRDRSRCAIRNAADFRSSGTPIPGCRVGVRRRERQKQSANRTAAGPPGPEAEAEEAENRRPRWVPAASRGMHACLYRHTEEAELGTSQGCACPPFLRNGSHRLHPG